MKNPLIILASTSPRRIDLMQLAGFQVQILSPNTDETPVRGESPRSMVARLAREKSTSVLLGLESRASGVIIAADTTVVAPDGRTILGKPVDTRDAERMLKKLSGHAHQVLTGYSVLGFGDGFKGLKKIRVVSSKVWIRKLDAVNIRNYVATKEPMDKAGAYAAQGIGMALVEKISGSYTNVVGLPMAQLIQDLESDFGISPLKTVR